MQVGFGLWQEQTQRLVMTPELRQAISILQFSSQELTEFLEREMIQNPVIEWSAEEWAKVAKEQRRDQERERSYSRETKDMPIETAISKWETLQEHLLSQLRLLPISVTERKIAEYIIGNLDGNGYLAMNIDEMADSLRIHVKQVETSLQYVQSLEPTGVGALDLRECLLLQLKEIGQDTPIMRKLIQDHLPDLAEGKFSKIAAALDITSQEVQKGYDVLKTLDPKPGRRYSVERPEYVVPDLSIEKVDGEYVVVLNDRNWPKIHINDFYRGILSQKGQDVSMETRTYITGKLNAALWLLRSLEQRRNTIFKVTQAIVEAQKDFFDYGIDALKPLTLRQIAEKVEMHESTVSRATTGKYAQTPRGVYELKYFFSSGVSSNIGGTSAESIKAKIKKWIAGENSKMPLSDQKITDMLQREGIHISRRTVAKYREELGILSSAKRRRV